MAVAIDVLAYDENEAEQSTSSTSFGDIISVNFNMSNAEDVIIMGCGSFRLDDDPNWIRGEAYADSDLIWKESSSPEGNVSERFSWGFIRKVNLSSGAHTVNMQLASNTGGQVVYAKYVSLIVFRDAASAASTLATTDEIIRFEEI